MSAGQEEEHPERVPGAEEAQADAAKFRYYLLNEAHPKGASKANFFRKIGIDQSDADRLRASFLAQLPYVPGRLSRENDFGGANYHAVMKVESTSGRVYNVDTYWEVHPQTGTKFLTATPGEADKVNGEAE